MLLLVWFACCRVERLHQQDLKNCILQCGRETLGFELWQDSMQLFFQQLHILDWSIPRTLLYRHSCLLQLIWRIQDLQIIYEFEMNWSSNLFFLITFTKKIFESENRICLLTKFLNLCVCVCLVNTWENFLEFLKQKTLETMKLNWPSSYLFNNKKKKNWKKFVVNKTKKHVKKHQRKVGSEHNSTFFCIQTHHLKFSSILLHFMQLFKNSRQVPILLVEWFCYLRQCQFWEWEKILSKIRFIF